MNNTFAEILSAEAELDDLLGWDDEFYSKEEMKYRESRIPYLENKISQLRDKYTEELVDELI